LSHSTDPSARGRRLSRRALIALAGLGATLVVAVPGALAIHDFTDVPDAHPFHAEIAAVKDAGITAGKTCVPPGTPPTYCPSEAITREAMAAFMHRGAGRIASEKFFASPIVAGPNALVADADVTVGGVNGQQLVYLNATFTAFSASVAAPCDFGIRLWEGGVDTGTLLATGFDDFPVAGENSPTFTISTVVLATSGFHQYQLSLAHNCSTDVGITGFNYIAATFAFGGNGTNVVIGGKSATGNANAVNPG
jgi:hypothetical protein